jgi:Excalibur calcium-binding domain
MLIAALLLAVSPFETSVGLDRLASVETAYTRKRRKAAGGLGRKFSSCAAARRAGYTHMLRGKTGYSANLDRDGDGIACDKMR